MTRRVPYTEFRYYSPEHDADYIRLSTTDVPTGIRNPGEFFMLLPWSGGKKWRERREEALECLVQAIEQGYDPGEIVMEAP